jgi:hypothetical protein
MVVDSSAVIAWIRAEPEADVIKGAASILRLGEQQTGGGQMLYCAWLLPTSWPLAYTFQSDPCRI